MNRHQTDCRNKEQQSEKVMEDDEVIILPTPVKVIEEIILLDSSSSEDENMLPTSQKLAACPPAIWSQREGLIFLTLNLQDCQDSIVKLEHAKVYFKGFGEVLEQPGVKTLYEVTINLFAEIDPEDSTYFILPHSVKFLLRKKRDQSPVYWPQLLKDNSQSGGWLTKQDDFDRLLHLCHRLGSTLKTSTILDEASNH